MPAQKVPPAPVRMATRISSLLSSSSMAAATPSARALLAAFFALGRLRVTVMMPSVTSTSTSSDIVDAPGLLPALDQCGALPSVFSYVITSPFLPVVHGVAAGILPRDWTRCQSGRALQFPAGSPPGGKAKRPVEVPVFNAVSPGALTVAGDIFLIRGNAKGLRDPRRAGRLDAPSLGSIQAMHWLARSASGCPRVDSSQSSRAMTRGSVGWNIMLSRR